MESQLTKKNCKHCDEKIGESATVCPHCQRDQIHLFGRFRPDRIGLLISFVMMLIAIMQLFQATQQLSSAQAALEEAKIAREEVSKLQVEAFTIVDEIQAKIATQIQLSLDAMSNINDKVFHMGGQDESSYKNYTKILGLSREIEEEKKRLSERLNELVHR